MIVVDASVIVTALADDGDDGDRARGRLREERLVARPLHDDAARRYQRFYVTHEPDPTRRSVWAGRALRQPVRVRPDVQTLTLDFAIRGVKGTVTVTVAVNDAPEVLWCDSSAHGFPVCEATVDIELRGYGALFGWVQVVGTRRSGVDERHFELDPLQVFDGVDTPFAFYGVHPVLFDAPSRRDRTQRLDWLAHSFLCASPASPMDRLVMPFASFRWGFVLDAGTIRLIGPEPLPLPMWTSHRPLLETAFPSWRFLEP